MATNKMAFIGFEQFASSDTVAEESKMIEPIYSHGDSDLSMISKKMLKRDPTTKLKGLAEFGSILTSKNPNTLRKFIPHWIHIYSRLSYDRDYRVRESLNTIHLELVKSFPKALQKRLQCIVGLWWMSVCDPHEAVAKLSTQSFAELFGSSSVQAMLEVEVDLARHFKEVMRCTPSSLVDNRLCTKEDAEDVFIRVTSSTILSIAKLFEGSYQPTNIAEMFDAQLWTCLESDMPAIRRSGYSLVIALSAVDSFTQNSNCVDELTPKLLKCMSEKHPPNLSVYWECLVSFLGASDLSRKHWNCDSQLLQALGSGRVPHTSIPSIVVQLQAIHAYLKKDKSKVKYYLELFDSLFRGKNGSYSSDSARRAVYMAAVSEASLLVTRTFAGLETSEENTSIASSAAASYLRVLDLFLVSFEGVEESAKFSDVLIQPLAQNIVDIQKFSSHAFTTLFGDIWVFFEQCLKQTCSSICIERMLLLLEAVLSIEEVDNSLEDRVQNLFALAVSQVKLQRNIDRETLVSETSEGKNLTCLLRFIGGVSPLLKNKVKLFAPEYSADGCDVFEESLLGACLKPPLNKSNVFLQVFFPLVKLVLSEALEYGSESKALDLWRQVIGCYLSDLAVLRRALTEITPILGNQTVFSHQGLDKVIADLLLASEVLPLSGERALLTSCLNYCGHDDVYPLVSDEALKHILSELCSKKVTAKTMLSLSILFYPLSCGKRSVRLSRALQPLDLLNTMFDCVGQEYEEMVGVDLWVSTLPFLKEISASVDTDLFLVTQCKELREYTLDVANQRKESISSDQWAMKVKQLGAFSGLLESKVDVYAEVGLVDATLWTSHVDMVCSSKQGAPEINVTFAWNYYEALLRDETTQQYLCLQPDEAMSSLLWSWLLVFSSYSQDLSKPSAEVKDGGNGLFASLLIKQNPMLFSEKNRINAEKVYDVSKLFQTVDHDDVNSENKRLERALVIGAQTTVSFIDDSAKFSLNIQVLVALTCFLQTCPSVDGNALRELFEVVSSIEFSLRQMNIDGSENAESLLFCFKTLMRFICSKFSDDTPVKLIPFIMSSDSYWSERLDASPLCELSLALTVIFKEADSTLGQQLSIDNARHEKVLNAVKASNEVSFHQLRWLGAFHPSAVRADSFSIVLRGIISKALLSCHSLQKLCSHLIAGQSLVQKYLHSGDSISALFVMELLSQVLPMIAIEQEKEEFCLTYLVSLKHVCCSITVDLCEGCVSLLGSLDSHHSLIISRELFASLALLMRAHASNSVSMCAFHILSFSMKSLFNESHQSVPPAAEEASPTQGEEAHSTQTLDGFKEAWSHILQVSVEEEVSLGSGGCLPPLQHLLTWILFTRYLSQARRGDKEVFALITQWIEELTFFGLFLSSCSRSYLDLISSQRKSTSNKALFNDFKDKEEYLVRWTDSDRQMPWLSGYALFQLVTVLPSLTRKWWGSDCAKALVSVFQSFVETEISQALAQLEVKIIEDQPQTDSFIIQGSSVSREVSARYVQDECVLELVVRLPLSYPLRNVEVDCRKRLGVSESRWRRWVLQIVSLLSTQDGSVLDAVMLWKSNVDKEFEGMEPCPICYCILHPKSLAMPSLECHTCNNKFHPSCLYKWFNTSHKSKCPLCQQPFNI